jgi:hypothetical protein
MDGRTPSQSQRSGSTHGKPARPALMMPFGTLLKAGDIQRAASSGEVGSLAQLLQNSWPSVSLINEALSTACANGRLDAALVLLHHGAAADQVSPYSPSPLGNAVDNGHVIIAEEMLRRGACVEGVLQSGETALGRAAFNGDAAMVKLLLDHKASPDAPHGGVGTPIDRALAGERTISPSNRTRHWKECIRLLEAAVRASFPATKGAVARWQLLRDLVRVRPFAMHWLADYQARRRKIPANTTSEQFQLHDTEASERIMHESAALAAGEQHSEGDRKGKREPTPAGLGDEKPVVPDRANGEDPFGSLALSMQTPSRVQTNLEADAISPRSTGGSSSSGIE